MSNNYSVIRELSDIPVGDTSLRVLGQGISHPFTFASSGKANSVLAQEGVSKINQSIHMILSTRLGDRMMLPEYGSRLPELVFEPLDDVLHSLLQFHTVEALARWEKRIEITGVVTIDDPELRDQNQISIMIEYYIRKFHVKGSYVYPFVLGALPFTETAIYGGR